MATFYMLRALVCCHPAVMPINLRRKSDKTHFDSAKKPLPQSGDVPLSTHLDAHLFSHAFGFAFWSKTISCRTGRNAVQRRAVSQRAQPQSSSHFHQKRGLAKTDRLEKSRVQRSQGFREHQRKRNWETGS